MSLLEDLAPVFQMYNISCLQKEIDAHVITKNHLGSGSFGSVFLAYRSVGGGNWVRIAVKETDFVGTTDAESVVARALSAGHESSLALSAAGPHVAEVYRPWFDVERGVLCLPQEVCDETLDRYDHRCRGIGVTSERMHSIFFQCIEMLEGLEQHGVVHNDIKPQNLLLIWPEGRDVGQPLVKLIDFGLSSTSYEIVDQVEPIVLGTPLFMAPETRDLSGADAPHARDVWSMGCVFYLLLTGNLPFVGRTREELTDNISRVVLNKSADLPHMDSTKLFLYHLARGMLVRDPTARPSPKELRARMLRATVPPQLPRAKRLTSVGYKRVVACRRSTVIPVYSQPSTLPQFDTHQSLKYGDSDIIITSEPIMPVELPAPVKREGSRTRGSGHLPNYFIQMKEANAATRARSMPALKGPVGRSFPYTAVPNPDMPWVRIVHPCAGYCLAFQDGHHLLHAFEDSRGLRCNPLPSSSPSQPRTAACPGRKQHTGTRSFTVAPLVSIVDYAEPIADGFDAANDESPSPVAQMPVSDEAVAAAVPQKKSKSLFRAIFSRKSKSRG